MARPRLPSSRAWLAARYVSCARRTVTTRFTDEDFSVVSNNCWGAHIYQEAGLPYRTPFVGLFIVGSDYLTLLEDIRILFDPLRFPRGTGADYPVGKLGDITLHFLHYANEAEAAAAWERRLARFTRRPDRVFYKFCSSKIADRERFARLPLAHKVMFTTKRWRPQAGTVRIPREYGRMPDGLRLSQISPYYFDAWRWIETGDGSPSPSRPLRTV